MAYIRRESGCENPFVVEMNLSNYCTLEVKKHEVTFRGSAAKLISSKRNVAYLYLHGYNEYKKFNNFNDNVCDIYINGLKTESYIVEESLPYENQKGEVKFRIGYFPIDFLLFAVNIRV